MKTPIQLLLFKAGISQAKVAAQLGIDAKTASQTNWAEGFLVAGSCGPL